MKNDNVMISGDGAGGDQKIADWPGIVQAFEVTPDKKVVWTLSAWNNSDLGTCTYIQMLTKKGMVDKNDTQQ